MTILQKVKTATIGAPNVDDIRSLYEQHLDYTMVQEATVAETTAAVWGLPGMVGRRCMVFQPASKVDTFIRAIEIDPVEGYTPMTTYGWNAIEVICDDTDAVWAKLDNTAFERIGEPRNLKGYESIRASQYRGPADEIVYMTCETGDRSKSLLPLPEADIGRVFIMVVAADDIERLMKFFREAFACETSEAMETTVDIIARAQGVPEDSPMHLGVCQLQEHGHLIEFDGYNPATSGPRPHTEGQLWPGVAMTSFVVDSLDKVNAPFVAEPRALSGMTYQDNRVACVHGPSGELIELIEA